MNEPFSMEEWKKEKRSQNHHRIKAAREQERINALISNARRQLTSSLNWGASAPPAPCINGMQII